MAGGYGIQDWGKALPSSLGQPVVLRLDKRLGRRDIAKAVASGMGTGNAVKLKGERVETATATKAERAKSKRKGGILECFRSGTTLMAERPEYFEYFGVKKRLVCQFGDWRRLLGSDASSEVNKIRGLGKDNEVNISVHGHLVELEALAFPSVKILAGYMLSLEPKKAAFLAIASQPVTGSHPDPAEGACLGLLRRELMSLQPQGHHSTCPSGDVGTLVDGGLKGLESSRDSGTWPGPVNESINRWGIDGCLVSGAGSTGDETVMFSVEKAWKS
ncbi:hypothetical protein BKA70DRAFT_1407436 [Coprinopsis sp. MPI-PUGE-AT-0042]|nr:hypothetical protein BKA70DRAFT_1407436 [Coprinopsis sp. MPI-PUGE-AT-0042]